MNASTDGHCHSLWLIGCRLLAFLLGSAMEEGRSDDGRDGTLALTVMGMSRKTPNIARTIILNGTAKNLALFPQSSFSGRTFVAKLDENFDLTSMNLPAVVGQIAKLLSETVCYNTALEKKKSEWQ